MNTTTTPIPTAEHSTANKVEPSCAKFAAKILEFCIASYPHDVNLSFGPVKIATGTGGFQYKTPANDPYIYSSENFKSNTVLCNYDEYITKVADLPECVGVNIQELNQVLKPENIIIDNPRPSDFHYFPFSSVVSTAMEINYHPVYYTFMKSMSENTREKMTRRMFFCGVWGLLGFN